MDIHDFISLIHMIWLCNFLWGGGFAFSARWTAGFSIVQAPNSLIVQCVNEILVKKLCFAFNCSARGRLILLYLIMATKEMFCHVLGHAVVKTQQQITCTVRFVNVVLQHNKWIYWKNISVFVLNTNYFFTVF